MQPDALAEKVRTTLRLRKERARLDEFTREFLKDKVGYVVGRNLKGLSEAILGAVRAAGTDTAVTLTSSVADEARKRYRFASTDSLIVIGSTVWSVGEVLDRLSVKSLPLRAVSAATITAGLHAQFRIWVQQELLAAEALRRGLDAVPAIERRVSMWKEYYLAEQVKGRLKEKVSVNEADVWSYLRAKDPATPVPQVKIRELLSGSLDGVNDALEDLKRGGSFEAVVRARSIDPAARQTGGLTDFFPVTDRFPVGDIASRMHPGDRYGPVAVRGGVLYFELVERKDVPLAGDTAITSRFASARDELLKNRQKKLVTAYLAQSARGRGFMIFEDRLKAITASPTPMMTFRILGFGGRMFEVPFVEKQVDWLTIDTPETRIAP
jgi:parvulin-like peptidyl-prolyl isomerase